MASRFGAEFFWSLGQEPQNLRVDQLFPWKVLGPLIRDVVGDTSPPALKQLRTNSPDARSRQSISRPSQGGGHRIVVSLLPVVHALARGTRQSSFVWQGVRKEKPRAPPASVFLQVGAPDGRTACAHLEHLRVTGAPPSWGQRFVEALNCSLVPRCHLKFSRHASSVAPRGCWKKIESQPRLCSFQYRCWSPLEGYVLWGSDIRKRHLAGFLVFLTGRVHRRLRFPRSHRCDQQKRRSAKKRHTGLSVVACRQGLACEPWADAWIHFRSHLSLHATTDHGLFLAMDETRATIPAITTKRNQLNLLARELLRELQVDVTFAAACTSRRCKTTTLSLRARAGAATEDRRLLGGHASSVTACGRTAHAFAICRPVHHEWRLPPRRNAVRTMERSA